MSETTVGKHLVVACGGTGGHFYPTLAIAKAYMALGNRVTLLVAGNHSSEQMEIAAQSGVEAVEVPAVRFPSSLLSVIKFPFRMGHCLLCAWREIRRLKPDIMLGMGSYASVPSCWVKPKRIPLVLHEGNAFMGKANRKFARSAKAIGLSLPLNDDRQLKGCASRLVGMPLREALISASAKENPDADFLPSLGLSSGKATVLVFGGSQGARRINELFTSMAKLMSLYADKVQFIHLTGTDANEELIEAYKSAGVSASVRKADSHIENCYLAADLVVCRGGASSLCELALFGKPAVIIPLPTAADDHQSFNARLAEAIGGAVHLPQAEATPERLASFVKDLLADKEHFTAMGHKLRKLASPDAAKKMAQLIADVLLQNE